MSRIDPEDLWLEIKHDNDEAAAKRCPALGMPLRENSRSEVEAVGWQPGPEGMRPTTAPMRPEDPA